MTVLRIFLMSTGPWLTTCFHKFYYTNTDYNYYRAQPSLITNELEAKHFFHHWQG